MSDDDAPRARVFRPRRPINRKTKKHIVFDPEARKEFLTGFRKRKLERRQKAQDELKEQLKQERKRLKQEARENFKKIVGSHHSDPTPEELATENYDLESHSVSIVELSTVDLAQRNNWIGPNRVQYEEDRSEDAPEEEEEVLPGMELKSVREVKIALKKKATKEVKKSRAFQQKNRIESQKNKKRAMQQRNRRMKNRKITDKRKGRSTGK